MNLTVEDSIVLLIMYDLSMPSDTAYTVRCRFLALVLIIYENRTARVRVYSVHVEKIHSYPVIYAHTKKATT